MDTVGPPDDGKPVTEWRDGIEYDGPLACLTLDQVLFLNGGSATHHGLRALDERDETSASILCEHFGGHSIRKRAQTIEVTRPGKERGCSAEVGFFGPGVVRVWSSNWEGLPQGNYEPWQLRKVAGIPERVIAVPRREETTTETLRQFLGSSEPEFDWLVPGLLERGDRVVLTGPEGYGKSTFLRQLGLGAAAGINTLASPLAVRHHQALRVLLVDLENSRKQLRRRFADEVLPFTDGGTVDRLLVEFRPDGLVLNNKRDEDRAWLAAVVEETVPDVLILGPIYKMIDGDPSDEAPNRDLVKWLDWLRTEHALAILLEAHTPHDAIRPFGWSGWKRWPEFGLHIHRDGRLEHWRAMREERSWPTALRRGGEGEWKWMPADASPGVVDSDEERIADCQPDVLRCLHAVGRPMSGNEVVLWLGKRRSTVLAAVARLEDKGFVVRDERGCLSLADHGE